MDENRLVDWIRKRFKPDKRFVHLGVGDDAARVGNAPGGWVVTTDALVEGVHFEKKRRSEKGWARKTVAVNVSDLAAMGAYPVWAVLNLGLPASWTFERALEYLKGIEAACRTFGVSLIGGDTVRSPVPMAAMTMGGRLWTKRALIRSGARVGDEVFVTGRLGGSFASGRHLSFIPRVRESEFLAKHYRVNAMMDLSDGLAEDLRRLCRASRVGACLVQKSIPVHPEAASVRDALREGEDFELLFTLKASEASRLKRDKRIRRKGFRFYSIGSIQAEQDGIKWITERGKRETLPPAKDHHFG